MPEREPMPTPAEGLLPIDQLMQFAGWALKAARLDAIGDWSGGDVQDAMLATGLLDVVRATEPCGEGCRCVEYDDFPQDCYRLSALGKACYATIQERSDADAR